MKKWLLMLACAFCAVSLSAAEMKIAVIDMGRVFQEYSKTKINEAKLKKQAEIFKDYSTRLSDQLKKLQEEFKDLRDASQNMAFTAAERENRRLNAADKYAQVTAKEKELRDYNREKQAELRAEYEKMRDGIIKDIEKVVAAKCVTEGYMLVLDKSGKTLNIRCRQPRHIRPQPQGVWASSYSPPSRQMASPWVRASATFLRPERRIR